MLLSFNMTLKICIISIKVNSDKVYRRIPCHKINNFDFTRFIMNKIIMNVAMCACMAVCVSTVHPH